MVSVHPDRTDPCNGQDDDCDGAIDEDATLDLMLVTIDSRSGEALRLDPATADAEVISELGEDININSLTVIDGGRTIAHTHTPRALHDVDICTGTIEELGRHGSGNACGIVWGTEGTLWGVENESDRLLQFDPDAGTADPVAYLDHTLGNCGMAYDCVTDTLWVADAMTRELFSLDPLTGLTTATISTDVPFGAVGLAYDPSNGAFLAVTGTELYSILPSTGESAIVGTVVGHDHLSSLSFHPTCD